MYISKNVIPFYASLINSCASTKNLKTLKQVHARAIRAVISHHDFIRAKLISSYSKCGQMNEATLIFSFTNRQSTFCYICLMRGFASISLFHHSLSFLGQMIVACKTIDRHTFPVAIKSCAGLSSLRLGQQIHTAVLTHGFALDTANSNSLITMYSKSGELDSARKVFDTMMGRNLVSWSAMMSGYEMRGDFEEVFFMCDTMVNVGILPDHVTFTILLKACSHGGLIEKGNDYFVMMKISGIMPGLEHYTCMVDMLGRKGHLDEAADLIVEMEPDEALWGVFLRACKRRKKDEVAERVARKINAKRLALANASKTGVAPEALQNATRRMSKVMTEQEARQILGVSDQSTWEEIARKYDSLFENNAKSGSFYLQSKVHRA